MSKSFETLPSASAVICVYWLIVNACIFLNHDSSHLIRVAPDNERDGTILHHESLDGRTAGGGQGRVLLGEFQHGAPGRNQLS